MIFENCFHSFHRCHISKVLRFKNYEYKINFFCTLHTDEQGPNWIGNFIAIFIKPKLLKIDWILAFKGFSVFPFSKFFKTLQRLFLCVVNFGNDVTWTIKTLCKWIFNQLKCFLFYKNCYRVTKKFTSYEAKMRQIWRLFICVL